MTLSSSKASESSQIHHLSKGAFLSVKDSTATDLVSSEELTRALQHAGYNPTEEEISKFWKKDSTTRLSFEDFSSILDSKELTEPSLETLIQSFKKMDPFNKGTISHDVFLSTMTSGNQFICEKSLFSLLSNESYNVKGSFLYKEYSKDVFETSFRLQKILLEKSQEQEIHSVLNSKTYKVKKKNPSVNDLSSSLLSSRGSFFFEEDSLISHQYILDVFKETQGEIEIQPIISSENTFVDSRLFVFKIVSEKSGETKYVHIGTTPMLISRVERAFWKCKLEIGSYLLIPSTTGCKFKKRDQQPETHQELVNSKNGKIELSEKFREILTRIYDEVDLDMNGTLSRTEFNLFNWRTSGEQIQNDEWSVIKDNFSLESGELSLSGFLQLHQLEAENNGGDSAELWVTLNAMGYNHNLEQDEASSFLVKFRCENEDFCKLRVCGLISGGSILDKALIRIIMDTASSVHPLANCSDVIIYKKVTSIYASVVIQNKSPVTVSLHLNFESSQNALINHPHDSFSTSLTGKSSLLAAHILASDPSQPLIFDLKETFLG